MITDTTVTAAEHALIVILEQVTADATGRLIRRRKLPRPTRAQTETMCRLQREALVASVLGLRDVAEPPDAAALAGLIDGLAAGAVDRVLLGAKPEPAN